MGRKKTSIEKKILESASLLFYTDGYSNTGIAKITEHAGTNKTTFYQYFHSKNELGHKYLLSQHRSLLRTTVALMRKSENSRDFCTRWFKLLKRRVQKEKNFNGCPLANYHSQVEFSQNKDKQLLHSLGVKWVKLLTLYFSMEIKAKRLSPEKSPQNLARMLFTIYQGALISWKLTQNIEVIDEAIELALSQINS